jgi:outer membrane protein OmpA-like peptidoglycan-associated protein
MSKSIPGGRAFASLLCAALVVLAAGCASTPKTIPELEQAREELQTARADPNAQRYAATEIEEAATRLSQAEKALEERKDAATVTHFAYLSTQSSKIAREQGKAKQAEERIAEAGTERERIRLEARTREVEEAHAATAEAQSAATAAGTQLAAAMEELEATRSERGLVVTLGDVHFDTGRAELKSGADRQLDMIANFLAQHPERYVLIEGFTDSVGSDEYNRDLSERRADAVRSALLTRGVDRGRVQIQGYGEQFPVGSNADSGGRQLNRRVEVILSTSDRPVTPRARL